MLESDPVIFLCALFLERTLETTLACPRLSVDGDDRRKTRAGDERDQQQRDGKPRSSPIRFSIIPIEREPEQPRTTRIKENSF